MYYVMDFDTQFPGAAMIMPHPVIPGRENQVFDKGIRIKGDIPVFDFIADAESQGVLTDYLWTSIRGLVLSARFRQTLDAVGVDNIDYYPVRVVNALTGETRSDYFVANVVGLVDCLNRADSQISFFAQPAGLIKGIENMAIDEDKIGGVLCCRLKDVIGIVFTHERVKEAVEKAKLTGVVFKPANGYNWP